MRYIASSKIMWNESLTNISTPNIYLTCDASLRPLISRHPSLLIVFSSVSPKVLFNVLNRWVWNYATLVICCRHWSMAQRKDIFVHASRFPLLVNDRFGLLWIAAVNDPCFNVKIRYSRAPHGEAIELHTYNYIVLYIYIYLYRKYFQNKN